MTFFSFLVLLTFISLLYLAIIMYYEDKINPANKFMALASLTLAASAFIEFICFQARDLANALFWIRLKFPMFFTVPLLVHYFLLYTESKWLRYKLTYILLYIPATITAVFHYFFIDPSSLQPVWGSYLYQYQFSFLKIFHYSWIIIDLFIWLVICFRYNVNPKSKNKLQLKYMSYTFLISALLGSLVMTISSFTHQPIPEFITIIDSIPSFIIMVYLIKRYKMFILEPATAANNIIATMTDAFLLVDPDGKIVNVNSATQELLGYRETELIGAPMEIVFHDWPTKNEYLQQTSDHQLMRNYETGLRLKTGGIIPVSLSSSLLKGNNDEMAGIVIIARDITESRQMALKMSYQATHDSLTELYNRNYFEEQIRGLIDNIKVHKCQSALLYLDLDQFKIVNDTCGHFVGDHLLKDLTALMKQQVRGSDIIARLGGDEFGILLENCPIEKACQIADRICCAIHEFRFIWDNKSFNTGVSIGVVSIDENVSNFDQVLSAADQACYAAKEKGGNRFHIYLVEDDELSVRQGEMQWISKINKSFAEDRFCLYAQLISPIKKGDQRFRFEVLIRMLDEDGTLIYPNAFLPAAGRFNLITSIDHWVINSFFKFYVRHCPAHTLANNFTCNINLSGASLNDSNFLDNIEAQFQKYRIPAGTICFEITETIAISNFNKVITFIEKLKKLGAEFALDDFGSGLMSFNYLKHLPVDYVKIDGIFIKNIIHNPVDLAMVESINQIAHLMKIKTVAEFVEDEASYRKLEKLGVDLVQGYWLGKPEPLEEFCQKGKDRGLANPL